MMILQHTLRDPYFPQYFGYFCVYATDVILQHAAIEASGASLNRVDDARAASQTSRTASRAAAACQSGTPASQ
jgi:hypothetical protein